ncbi:MAG: SDR family oxidoreductase [Actinobacteria bacterium]|nr:SDR family oxidoreductase [Actinomycetota bacterium]
MNKEQRTAVVTGSSSGLGLALATQLVDRGWTVVGVSRGQTAPTTSLGIVEIRGSVDSQDTVDAVLARVAELGRWDLLINCAGAGVFGDVGTYSVDDIQEVLRGNLIGLIAMSDAAVRVMAGTGGDIVNVMSTAAKKLRTAESVYTAAKWGAKAYTRTLRDAVKSKGFPIRVFEVYPCGMDTHFWAAARRPVTDGSGFPSPDPIATQVLDVVCGSADSYCLELTFERA